MRQKLDAWATYVASISLIGYLERRLGGPFTDDEVDGVQTLRGLAALVETRLAPNDCTGSKAIEIARKETCLRRVRLGDALMQACHLIGWLALIRCDLPHQPLRHPSWLD
jgi:hypothetical protein